MRAHAITTEAQAGARGRTKRRIVPGGILALSLAVVLFATTASTASTTKQLDGAALRVEFGFGKVKKNTKKGTAKLTVEVPAPGELDLAKTKKVKADEGAITPGGAFVSIKPRGKAKKKLNNEGKANVKAIVTYTRTGGSPNTKDKKIKLVKR
jgi:hypothetical protein